MARTKTLNVKIGDHIETFDGHRGQVTYLMTCRYGSFIHVEKSDGSMWYGSVSAVSSILKERQK